MPCNTITPKISREACLDSPTASPASKTLLNNKLPLEMLAKIFKYIAEYSSTQLPLDVLDVSLVCTNWQRAAELLLKENMFDDPLYDTRFLSSFEKFIELLRQSAELGVNYGYRVQCITVYLDNFNRLVDAENTYIAISQLCPYAHKLRIKYASFNELPSIACNLHEVGCILLDNPITELHCDEIEPWQLNAVLRKGSLKNLRKINLAEHWSSDKTKNEGFLRELASNAKDLWCLKLNDFYSITGAEIKAEDIHWPKLQYLLLHNSSLTWGFMRAVIKACPRVWTICCPFSMTDDPNHPAFAECRLVEVFLEDHGFQVRRETERRLWRRWDNINWKGKENISDIECISNNQYFPQRECYPWNMNSYNH